MGLFSSKKKIYVSSSVWNMAGDIKDRANYLKSVVMGNILFDSPTSLGEAIPSAYLNGPGMGFRRYARWARGSSNYDDNVGSVGGGVRMGNSLDPATLQAQIPHGPTEFVILGENDIGWADYTWWAEEYMVNNHQDLLFTDWFAEIADGTNEITITFADTTTTTFSPVGYDPSKKYLYALYQTVSGGVTGPTVSGVDTEVPDEASFPPIPSGMVLFSDTDTEVSVTLNILTTVDVTYSDATPPEHTETPSTVDTTYTKNVKVYHKYTIIDNTNSTRDIHEETRSFKVADVDPVVTVEVEDIGGGVTKTTTTTVEAEELVPFFSYRDDVQTVDNDYVSLYQYFRYEENTGNITLDAMFVVPDTTTAFLPYIPIRINNKFLRDINPTIYAQTKRAYFRAMAGASLDKLLDKIEENDQLGDLDFIYAVYGTSLNSPENTARKYMYRFFTEMLASNPDVLDNYAIWEDQWALADAYMDAYIEWLEKKKNMSANRYAGPPPTKIPYPNMPVLEIDTRSTTKWMNFHLNIAFNGGVVEVGAGVMPGKKKGDYWLENGPIKIFKKRYARIISTSNGSGSGNHVQIDVEYIKTESLYIYWQETDSNWRRITLYGLVHTNYVYKNKTVVIKGSEAMADPEESGFIIPLHEATFRSMSLVDQTQLATASCYLMFNCYVVKKKKWYQSGFFKVLLVVVIVVVSVVFPPAGAGSAGILGSSAAVGTTLGFTGTAAIVAGTVANAIAAMIVTRALTEAFGDTWGTVLGTIVTVGLTISGGVMGGGSFDVGSFATELSRADNLIAISDGLVKSVGAYMQEKTNKILAETQAMMERYKSDMLEVQKQYEEMFGTGTNGVIDPLMLTSASQLNLGESRGSFLERTLMCGSDVAELSQDLVRNFSDITLNLDLPM